MNDGWRNHAVEKMNGDANSAMISGLFDETALWRRSIY
jgi:hypothetical protein